MKKLLKYNLLSLLLVVGLIMLGVVIAENVFVKQGSLRVDENLNVSNVLFVDSANNRVGIGTASPSWKLHVLDTSTTSSPRLKLEGLGGSYLEFNPSGTYGARISSGSDDLKLLAGGSEVMRLSNGKLGVGTISPAYPLTVIKNVSGISIWSDGNISASGYITRTSVWDSSKGNALNWIKDSSELIVNGEVNHDAFLPTEPIIMTISRKVSEKEVNGEIVDIYQDFQEEGVLIDEIIAKHEQAIYELKTENELLKSELCKKDSYSWC